MLRVRRAEPREQQGRWVTEGHGRAGGSGSAPHVAFAQRLGLPKPGSEGLSRCIVKPASKKQLLFEE